MFAFTVVGVCEGQKMQAALKNARGAATATSDDRLVTCKTVMKTDFDPADVYRKEQVRPSRGVARQALPCTDGRWQWRRDGLTLVSSASTIAAVVTAKGLHKTLARITRAQCRTRCARLN